jgi:hypothetical protein
MKTKTIYPLLFLFILAASLPVLAQTSTIKTTLVGIVADQAKTPVPYAQVFIINEKGNAFRALTDSNGNYSIAAEAGVYTLVASCESARCYGFQPFETDKVILRRGENKTLDITLKVLPPDSAMVEPDSEIRTTVTGYVYDGRGARIADAALTFTDFKGQCQTAKSDDYGRFSIKLSPNEAASTSRNKYYSVKIEMLGFETLTLDRYSVPQISNTEIHLDVALKIQAMVDYVDVTEQPAAKKP